MPVYLDHNATSPPEPRVVDAMLLFLLNHHGNISNVHGMVCATGLAEV